MCVCLCVSAYVNAIFVFMCKYMNVSVCAYVYTILHCKESVMLFFLLLHVDYSFVK